MKQLAGTGLREYMSYYFYTKIRVIGEWILFVLPNDSKLRKIKKLKDSKKGCRAFVFANGPSMNKLSPHKIKAYQDSGFDVFAGNGYISTKFAEIIKPNYYIFSDPIHFGIYKSYVSDINKESAKKDYEKVVNLNITLFIPHRYCRSVKYGNTYAFNDSSDPFCKNVKNMMRKRGHVSMTLYKALGIACYMGYETIYICGFDNDWFKYVTVDVDNNIFIEDHHFYDGKQVNTKSKIEWAQDTSEAVFNSFAAIASLEKFRCEPIVNLDPDSLVNCFSKKHELDVYHNKK